MLVTVQKLCVKIYAVHFQSRTPPECQCITVRPLPYTHPEKRVSIILYHMFFLKHYSRITRHCLIQKKKNGFIFCSSNFTLLQMPYSHAATSSNPHHTTGREQEALSGTSKTPQVRRQAGRHSQIKCSVHT